MRRRRQLPHTLGVTTPTRNSWALPLRTSRWERRCDTCTCLHTPVHCSHMSTHAPFICLRAHAELLLVPACTCANLPQKQLIEPDLAPYLLLWCCNARETVLSPTTKCLEESVRLTVSRRRALALQPSPISPSRTSACESGCKLRDFEMSAGEIYIQPIAAAQRREPVQVRLCTAAGPPAAVCGGPARGIPGGDAGGTSLGVLCRGPPGHQGRAAQALSHFG